MYKKGLISVIIPVYNQIDYVSECLNSVIFQKYKNLQIIIIDDGSNDGSEKICDEFEAKDARITVYHLKNCGLSNARNFGIEHVIGEYLAFVDSDDTIDKNYFDSLYKDITDNDADIAISGRYRYHKQNFNDSTKVLEKNEAIKWLHSDGNFDISAWGKLYRSIFFEKTRFPVGQINEDYAVNYSIFYKLINKVTYNHKQMYFYRPNSKSLTSKNNVDDYLYNFLTQFIEKIDVDDTQIFVPYVRYELMRYMVSQINFIYMNGVEKTELNLLHKYISYIKLQYKATYRIVKYDKKRFIQFYLIDTTGPVYGQIIRAYQLLRKDKRI